METYSFIADNGGDFRVERYDGATGGFLGVLPDLESFTIGGMTFNPDGDLFVADAGQSAFSGKILRFAAGDFAPQREFLRGLNDPFAIAFGLANNLYVQENNVVRRYGGLSGALNRVATVGGDLQGKLGIAFVPSNPGDTIGDGLVNIDDLNNVRNHFGATGTADGTLIGDAFPFDGVVNIDDLNAVRNHFGERTAAAIPEPSALLLAAINALICLMRADVTTRRTGPATDC